MEVVRLKDKLGVRSMASAECILQDTVGKLVGKEGEGFKLMADMINLSRLYNALASLSEMRRGLTEAYTFLQHRESFGKPSLQHAIIREKLWELASKYVTNFYLSWHAVRLLDKADKGEGQAAEVLRLLTPMVKKKAALTGVYLIRESMELMGGLGYIEDTVMPKLMRDTMVLPIGKGQEISWFWICSGLLPKAGAWHICFGPLKKALPDRLYCKHGNKKWRNLKE